jgi:chromosome segregation ATPase
MSDEKLDLILNVVTDIRTRQDGLEKRFDGLEQRFDGLEQRFDGLDKRFDGLDKKVDNLSSEFTDFKKQTAKSFAIVHNRFALLEKQMYSIGVEVKEEIKAEIKAVNENIDRLEKEILFARSDSVDTRVKVRELEHRLSRLENHIGLTV